MKKELPNHSMKCMQRSMSDRLTFKTIYDYMESPGAIEAYNYLGDEIKGSDTVLKVILKQKDFNIQII
jgi:hypothetical protein